MMGCRAAMLATAMAGAASERATFSSGISSDELRKRETVSNPQPPQNHNRLSGIHSRKSHMH